MPPNITQSDIVNYLAALNNEGFISALGSGVISAIAAIILPNKIAIANEQIAALSTSLANAQSTLSTLQS